MTDRLYLGIDTSNYTTSAALVNDAGEVLLNSRQLLPVPYGERGLRQSDAVFAHVRQLPLGAEAVSEVISKSDGTIAAVGCSSTPRDSEKSYMPCFLAGLSAASMAASVLGVPLYTFSHQAGHVMAAVSSVSGKKESGFFPEEFPEPFLSFHISGGTTDLLYCSPDRDRVLTVERIGGTKDLNAGQVLDRIGVLMGLSFPAGAEMDRMALGYGGRVPRGALSVKGTECNLSGLENKARELFESSNDRPLTAAYTLSFIARTLSRIAENAFGIYGRIPLIFAGGVMSSAYIRKILASCGRFADPACSSDNAVGVAFLAREKYHGEGRT